MIPDRAQPQLTMIAPKLRRQGVGDKHATDVVKWKKLEEEHLNMIVERPTGKLES